MKLVSGGYLLAKPSARTACHQAHLVPAKILSASSCLSEHVPGFDLYGGAGYPDEAVVAEYPNRFETADDLIATREFLMTLLRDGQLEYPSVFVSVDAAREFARRLKPEDEPLVLFGISTAKEHADALLHNVANFCSCVAVLRRNLPPERGEVLGWEVLGDDYGHFHSWFCNSIEITAERWGIKPNANGFLDFLEEAERVASYCNQPDTAEPGYWAPWQITRYPL